MRTQHRGEEVRRGIAAVILLELLTVLLISAIFSIPARTDMILTAYLDEGAAVHNGTHICMPEARVRANITWNGGMLTSMKA